jgi:hypothetical protein
MRLTPIPLELVSDWEVSNGISQALLAHILLDL